MSSEIQPVIPDTIHSQPQIESLIYTVRGVQVMLDRDLAMLYNVETRVLNQAVKRNLMRFPEDFMFQLTKEEVDNLRSQNVILNEDYASRSQNVILNETDLQQEQKVKRGQNIKYLIDDQLYNFGASLKDLGKRWFSFSVINDPGVKFHILSELM